MGKFMDVHANKGQGTILTTELDMFLKAQGFHMDTCAYGGDERGWVNGYSDTSGTYFYRIHITGKLIRVHYEYECGGLVWDREYDVKNEHLENIRPFVKFLDTIYEEMDI